MEVVLSLVMGVLYSAGVYLMLRRNIIKLILGLALISHAANLLIFIMSRLVRGHPALISQGQSRLTPPYSDPLPQAMILTAIVISFGVLAFAVVLIRQSDRSLGTNDVDKMRETDSFD